ncbi:MAG: hypothetical protein K5761_07915 [Clostridiales bacterium]|nr:hypothetical protein [Clostridiales bacterium]
MRKAVRVLSVLLCICILFTSCASETQKEENTTEEIVTEALPVKETVSSKTDENLIRGLLPFNDEDGLNPFFAQTYENQYLMRLVYYPLFSVDSEFNAVPVIAESITMSGKTVVVSIKKNLVCHESSEIRASDVVYSFNMAKKSVYYKNELDNIESAMVSGTYTVDFTLTRADLFSAVNFNFPIVKSGSADGKTKIPTGYGAYYYNNMTLVPCNGEGNEIKLYSSAARDSIYNEYKVGNSSVYFSDLSDCNFVQSIGQEKDIQLTNMVYLGINQERGSLNSNIRSAIALLIDSDEIAEECYQGHATAVKIPSFKLSSPVASSANKEGAERIIDSCGYTYYAGKALTNGAYVLSFSLIVNKDNTYRLNTAHEIADRLNEAGFYIEVKPLSFSDYKERVESGNYDLYLGEIKLDTSFSLSPFFEKDGTVSNGISKKVSKDYYKMRSGSKSEEYFIKAFVSDYPFVPICFRKGYVLYANGLPDDFERAPYDIYYNVF